MVIFKNQKRKQKRRAVIITAVSSLQTTSSFLQTEADFDTNMNSAATETGLVVLLLALSGTVDVTMLLRQSDDFRDHE